MADHKNVPEEAFKERRWHWWLSRVAIPLTVALVALGGLLYVNHDKAIDADVSSTPMTATAPAKPAADNPYTGGWGPDRETFTTQVPASYAVLNSITNNPVHGDERNFVQIRHVQDSNEKYDDIIRATAGDELVVYVYIANDCADNFASSPPSALHGLTAQLINDATGTDLAFSVTLAAKNASAVWDGASVITTAPSHLAFVAGSAFMHTAFDGFAPNSTGFDAGVPMLLGQKRQDGEYAVGVAPNGLEIGAGFLTFRLRVEPSH